MNEPIIRMYVDENGHQSLKGDLSQNDKRFLCMTGIIMPIREHDSTLTPMMQNLKERFFGGSDIILHRRELVSAKPPFEALLNESTREQFNNDLLQIVTKVQYRVVSVVIDKYRLVQKHGIIRAQDPYALALEYLMQRYQYWLQDYQSLYGTSYGDILAEARGGGEDKITKTAYNEIYLGKGYNPLKNAADVFSSSQIKLKPKSSNIAGLQFADLLSHPARRYILSQNGLADNIKTGSYEQQIVDILVKSKFRRKNGIINGAGVVLYPR